MKRWVDFGAAWVHWGKIDPHKNNSFGGHRVV